MGDLIDELEGLVVLEHNFLLVLLLILLSLLIRLPPVYLKLLTLGVLTQLEQKLSLFLKELK